MRTSARNVALTMCTLMMFTAGGCKTTGNSEQQLKAAGEPADDIPALTVEKLTPAMIGRIVNEARKDASAMFGGKALFHGVIFDNSIDQGPCAGFLGARIIFANPERNPEPYRKYAMYTLDPVPSGPETCVNSVSAGTKGEDDVRSHVSGTRNFETALGGSNAIRISVAEAIKKLRADNPKFEVPLVVSIMNPADEMMKSHPWAMVYGRSCGEGGVAYVNLATGVVVPAANPMKKDCN